MVYQGHHGDRGATAADVILPGAAYTEKNATYVNTEGRPQRGKLAVFPPGEAKEDWKILRALSEVLGPHACRSTRSARCARRMAELAPHARRDRRDRAGGLGRASARAGELDRAPFASPIADFYRTNPISRASAVMAECSALFVGGGRAGRPAPMAELWSGIVWPVALIVLQILLIVVPLLVAVAYVTYAERKVIGAMQLRQGPMTVGPVRPAAADRRRPQAVRQGDHRPERRQQGRLPRWRRWSPSSWR